MKNLLNKSAFLLVALLATLIIAGCWSSDLPSTHGSATSKTPIALKNKADIAVSALRMLPWDCTNGARYVKFIVNVANTWSLASPIYGLYISNGSGWNMGINYTNSSDIIAAWWNVQKTFGTSTTSFGPQYITLTAYPFNASFASNLWSNYQSYIARSLDVNPSNNTVTQAVIVQPCL